MNRSLVLAGIAISAILILVGCGAAPAATTPAPVATATPTTVPTATPTPDLTAAAAAAYLAAATTGNAADASINKAYPKSMSVAQAKRYWPQIETVERTFLTTIFAIAYPASMKADVDAQIAAETKVVADETQLAANPDDTGAYAAFQADVAAEAGTANIVRHDLGLPQVPLT